MAKLEEVKINKSFIEVFEVETESFITIIEGWRMRVYFDVALKDLIKVGQLIEVSHEGELKNPHSVKFQKLK